MIDIWDGIKETAKSFGGAATAPAGLVWDVASAPFDDDDDSILGNLGEAVGDTLDPLLNPETYSGMAVGGVMDAANWTLDNVVNEPASAGITMGHHLMSELREGGPGAYARSLFSGDDWARAYRIAQDQSAGESWATSTLGGGSLLTAFTGAGAFDRTDPFDYENPYDEFTHPRYGKIASTVKWGTDVSGAFILDPFAGVGRGLGALNRAHRMGRLNNAQRAELGTLLSSSSKEASRVGRWMEFIGGKNTLGRSLTAPEILAATPELRKWSSTPHVIAGLVADANKIEDPISREKAIKSILTASGGDPMAIKRLQAQQDVLPYIADELKNLRRGNVLDLKHIAANPSLARNPLFVKHLEDQIHRLDSDESITKAIDAWSERLDTIMSTERTLANLPGFHSGGNIALRRANDTGITRAPKRLHKKAEEKADAWVQRKIDRAAAGDTHFLMLQKSAYTVPLLVAKTAANAVVGPYTKMFPAVSDALRQTHYVPFANLHQWGDSVTQLNSMMRLAQVPDMARKEFLGKAALAASEAEKQRFIAQAEKMSVGAMVKRTAAETGEEIDGNYLDALMVNYAQKRKTTTEAMWGRAYAATIAGEDIAGNAVARFAASRGRGIAAAEDDVTREASRRSASATPAPDEAWTLRVDQILDDDGLPTALPLFESQLANRVPLMDVALAKKLLKQDQSHLSRLSRTWKAEAGELEGLLSKRANAKGAAAVWIDNAISAKRASLDWLVDAGQKASRFWKMSVLFRLGYPARVVMDDHWRIWTQMNAGRFYAENGEEAVSNFLYNRGARHREAKAAMAADRERAIQLRDLLDSDEIKNYETRMAELRKATRSAAGHRGQITKARNSDTLTEERLAHHEEKIAEAEADAARIQAWLGDYDPDEITKELDSIVERLRDKGNYLPEKRALGARDVDMGDGVSIPGGFAGGHGAALRGAASSKETFEYQQQGVEEVFYNGSKATMAMRTITPDEPGHIGAWADALNNQFRNSRVAMFFVKGGSVDEFTQWMKAAEQADLRKRLPHFAHDAEDWGERVIRMVEDYIPNEQVRDKLARGGAITRQDLARVDKTWRPNVHGKAVGDTLGVSARSLGIGSFINKAFSFLSDVPTDRLSRHPFFNAMYKQHAREMYATMKASYAKSGQKFTQADLDRISRQARTLALGDVKRTLFDMSAHSHAAHVMRFISPFFAAHQEVLSRWWRIVGDNPGTVRRFQQAFDLPRHAGWVIDENGDPVKPGDPISVEHKILVPAPHKLLPDWLVPDSMESDGRWEITENSFNLVLQGGLTNPGAGPLVVVPTEALTQAAADDTRVARVARLLNPYPPDSPGEAAVPAWAKRAMAWAYGVDETTDLGPFDGLGAGDWNTVGKREFFDSVGRNLQDLEVDFKLKNDREPTKAEADQMWEEALAQATGESMLKFLSNATSPFPARPNSKYAAIQDGWWKIRELSRKRYPNDWEAANEWAISHFKEKYGPAYMPLIYSDAANPAGLDGSPADVDAFKKYQNVVQNVDPRLARAVMGAYSADSGVSTERTPEGVNFFEDMPLTPGSSEDFFGTEDPREAMDERLARRGWQKYAELTGALTAKAQQMGYSSYREVEALDALRRAGLEKLKAENYAFKADIESFDTGQYDSYLDDMRKIVNTPILANDPARTDIDTLAAYLKLRDYFVAILDARQAAGLGGVDAQAQEPVRELYTSLVGRLVESNTHFESFIYNGLVDRDPLLVGE